MSYHLGSIAHPAGRSGPCTWIPLYYTARARKVYLLLLATAQPMSDSHNSANEKPLYFQLPVYSNGLFVYNSVINSTPSSTKGHSSPLFCGLASLRSAGLLVLGCNSLLLLTKPILADKITGGFSLKVTDCILKIKRAREKVVLKS